MPTGTNSSVEQSANGENQQICTQSQPAATTTALSTASTANNFTQFSASQQYPFLHNHQQHHHNHQANHHNQNQNQLQNQHQHQSNQNQQPLNQQTNVNLNSQEAAVAAAAALTNSCLQLTNPSSASKKSCLTCADISIKWYIVVIALLGLICALIGTIVGAIHSAGRDYIALTLLLIGVGLVLVAIAWVALRITIKTYKTSSGGRPILPVGTSSTSISIPTSSRLTHNHHNHQQQHHQSRSNFLSGPQMNRLLSSSSSQQAHQQCPPPNTASASAIHRSAMLNERLYMMAAAAAAAAAVSSSQRAQQTTTNNTSANSINATLNSTPSQPGTSSSQSPDADHASNSLRLLMNNLKSRLPRRLARLIPAGTATNVNATSNETPGEQTAAAAAAAATAAALLHQYQQQIHQHQHHFLFPNHPANQHLQFGAPPTFGAPLSDFPNYRPPPPSYSASMQDQRLRMLMQERANLQQLQQMYMFPTPVTSQPASSQPAPPPPPPPPPPPSVVSSNSNQTNQSPSSNQQINQNGSSNYTTAPLSALDSPIRIEQVNRQRATSIIIQNPINRRVEIPRASVNSTLSQPKFTRQRNNNQLPTRRLSSSSLKQVPSSNELKQVCEKGSAKDEQRKGSSLMRQERSSASVSLKSSSSSPIISPTNNVGCLVNNDIYVSSTSCQSNDLNLTQQSQTNRQAQTTIVNIVGSQQASNEELTVNGGEHKQKVSGGARRKSAEIKILGYL